MKNEKIMILVQKFKILDTYIHTIHSILTPKQLSHHFKRGQTTFLFDQFHGPFITRL